MIKKTKWFRFVFPVAVTLSYIFTAALFFRFGAGWTKIIWLAFASVFIAFQVFILSVYKNSIFRRKPNQFALGIYLFLTFVSVLSTFAFGITDIKNTEIQNADVILQIKKIDNELSRLENLRDVSIYDNQIQKLNNQISNLTYRVSERAIQLTSEIERIRNKKRQIDIQKIDNEIARLEKNKIDIAKKNQSPVLGVEIFAKTIGINTYLAMSLLLFLFSITLELIVFYSSGYFFAEKTKSKNKKQSEKQSKKYQLSLYENISN